MPVKSPAFNAEMIAISMMKETVGPMKVKSGPTVTGKVRGRSGCHAGVASAFHGETGTDGTPTLPEKTRAPEARAVCLHPCNQRAPLVIPATGVVMSRTPVEASVTWVAPRWTSWI